MAKLTSKQKKALRKAPKRAKARMARNFGLQRGGGYGSSSLRGIKQGVGRSTVKAFGGMSTRNYHPCCLDAFHQAHLPLPRPTGPYSVVRTTQEVAVNEALTILGPIFDRNKGTWDRQFYQSWFNEGQSIGTTNNANGVVWEQLKSSSWNGVQLVPSAFSVQVMNPQAIQTTTGIIYMGRIRTSLKTSENLTLTPSQLAQYLISYNNPRLLSAAKMAFRGVQVDLVPFNMSELANFCAESGGDSGKYTITADSPDYVGFAPMFIWNPNKIPLQILACCEWRVRFDPSNPAQATHVQHVHAPESFWARALHGAEAVGNGVVDIAEKVADTGNALFGAMGATYNVARGARALRGANLLALGM